MNVNNLAVGDVLAQGDVVLVKVDGLPAGSLTEVPRDKGCVVLAYGEVTGHAHAISGAAVQLSLEEEKYLVVTEALALIHGTLPGNGKVESLEHPEHSPIDLSPGCYRVLTQRTYAWGESTRVLD